MNGWDLLGPMVCCYFHQADLKEYPKGPSNIIHSNPCRIATNFFIQGHLLGHGFQTTLVQTQIDHLSCFEPMKDFRFL